MNIYPIFHRIIIIMNCIIYYTQSAKSFFKKIIHTMRWCIKWECHTNIGSIVCWYFSREIFGCQMTKIWKKIRTNITPWSRHISNIFLIIGSSKILVPSCHTCSTQKCLNLPSWVIENIFHTISSKPRLPFWYRWLFPYSLGKIDFLSEGFLRIKSTHRSISLSSIRKRTIGGMCTIILPKKKYCHRLSNM